MCLAEAVQRQKIGQTLAYIHSTSNRNIDKITFRSYFLIKNNTILFWLLLKHSSLFQFLAFFLRKVSPSIEIGSLWTPIGIFPFNTHCYSIIFRGQTPHEGWNKKEKNTHRNVSMTRKYHAFSPSRQFNVDSLNPIRFIIQLYSQDMVDLVSEPINLEKFQKYIPGTIHGIFFFFYYFYHNALRWIKLMMWWCCC